MSHRARSKGKKTVQCTHCAMQKSSFVDFKYLKGRPCSFPFVYEGLVGSPSGSMSRKNKLILLAQNFYLLGLNPDDR